MILFEDSLPTGLRRFVRLMVRIKTTFVVITLPILPITFFFVVFFRYILERDLFAYEEWLMPICFWMFFLASALGTYNDKQINADLLDSFTENQFLLWLRKVVITVIELVITLFVLHWAWLMLADEIAAYPRWKMTIALKIPFFILQPIVENVFKYSFVDQSNPKISIIVSERLNAIEILIIDNCHGQIIINNRSSQSGLNIVRKKLELYDKLLKNKQKSFYKISFYKGIGSVSKMIIQHPTKTKNEK